MTRAARSIFVFGIYVVVLGVLLSARPEFVLAPFGFPQPHEPWVHVLGVVVGVLGCYYVAAAREEASAFFRWTIWGRALVLVWFAVLVLAGLAPAQIVLFGLVDAAGGAWTAFELRARRR